MERRPVAPVSVWQNEGKPYWGNGEDLIVSIPDGEQSFYDIRVYDVDTDGDGLTDWEGIKWA